MPIQIGQTEPGCEDPVGLMTACHRRIERFLRTLCDVAQTGGRLEGEREEAFSRALRYFREAAPQHTADEEQDLFPAVLRAAPVAAASVQGLEQDHHRAAELHSLVDRVGREWLSSGFLEESDLGGLRQALSELDRIYREHIRIEESEVFPLASRVLEQPEIERIGRRMAQRRGVPA
jgi:hemerythrin-like domain-containing protein